MIITLTDKSGVQFDINTLIIEEIHGSPSGTVLILSTGERLLCKESSTKVMKTIIDAEFREEH